MGRKDTIFRRYILLFVIMTLFALYCALQVQAAERITITGSNVVAKGKIIQLKADQKVKWKSSRPNIAKVSKNGRVRGIRPGTAVITATSRKNPAIKRRIRICVKKKAAQRLKLSENSVTLDLTRDPVITLSAAATPLKAAQVFEWSSSDEDTVYVSRDGVVRARKEGSAQITCMTIDGSKKRVTVSVTVTDKAREEREAAELEASYWNILLIGNSYTQDEFSYVPFFMKEYFPGLRFRIGILHQGGCNLATHYYNLMNDGSYSLYSEYTSEDSEWNSVRNVHLSQVISKYRWKIVTLQQSSALQGDYSTMEPYIKALMDGYTQKIGSRPKYLYVFPHLRGSGNEEMYAEVDPRTTETLYKKFVPVAQKVVKEFGFDGIIQNATAIENARKTSLNSLSSGQDGDMTEDSSSHLREGIPCLVANYCSFLRLLPYMGLPQVGLDRSCLYPTTAWVSSQKIPGKDGSSVGAAGDNAEKNKLLAAKCAEAAVQKPYEITIIPES